MRAIFSVLSLILVLAVVGLLVKKQLASNQQAIPSLMLPSSTASGAPGAYTKPAGTVHEQSQNVQQQYKQAINAAMQQPRPEPDEK
jgi:energy-converting hydrogenase Eha subunit F